MLGFYPIPAELVKRLPAISGFLRNHYLIIFMLNNASDTSKDIIRGDTLLE
jgi:hypothetical protein